MVGIEVSESVEDAVDAVLIQIEFRDQIFDQLVFRRGNLGTRSVERNARGASVGARSIVAHAESVEVWIFEPYWPFLSDGPAGACVLDR